MDALFLDAEIRAVLDDDEIEEDQKWIHYYLCVKRYLYKRNPSGKPQQFKFDTSNGRNGKVRYAVRDPPWYRRKSWRRYSCLTSLFGPVLGALLSTCLRGRDFW